MVAEEMCLQLVLESCDGLSHLDGGWQFDPPERSREGVWRVTLSLVVKEQQSVTHSVT